MSDVQKLIIRAFKRIKIYAEDMQVGLYRESEALEYLNLIIKSLNNSTQNIPILDTLEFQTTPDQRTYKIGTSPSDIIFKKPIDINYIRITESNVVYIVDKWDMNTFYNSYINETTKCRPRWFCEREGTNYSEIVFFQIPDKIYDVTVEGTFEFVAVTSNDDLSQFPGRYLLYLELELARNLQGIYPSQPWTPQNEIAYQEAKDSVKNKNPVDLSSSYRAGAKCVVKYNRHFSHGRDYS